MIYSKRLSCIFVHVPKTGGTSLVEALKPYANRPPLPLRAIGYLFDDHGRTLPEALFPIVGYPYHITARRLARLWGPDRFDALFSFGFVRNPWDLTLSEYLYILRRRGHPKRAQVRRLSGFSDYVRWKRDHYARQQTEWLFDAGDTLLVDRVGRFENYSTDANRILEQLGLGGDIPHRNSTEHLDFRTYYDDATAHLVEAIFPDDIRHFGYRFE